MEEAKRKALTDMYGELAQELRIAYLSFTYEGFTPEETIVLMTALISQPYRLEKYGRQTMSSRAQKMEKLRKYMNERKAQVEKDDQV